MSVHELLPLPPSLTPGETPAFSGAVRDEGGPSSPLPVDPDAVGRADGPGRGEGSRVPGVTGWSASLLLPPANQWWTKKAGAYTLSTWTRSDGESCTWTVSIGSATVDFHAVPRKAGEQDSDYSLRVRLLAEAALEQHLAAALAALRGTT